MTSPDDVRRNVFQIRVHFVDHEPPATGNGMAFLVPNKIYHPDQDKFRVLVTNWHVLRHDEWKVERVEVIAVDGKSFEAAILVGDAGGPDFGAKFRGPHDLDLGVLFIREAHNENFTDLKDFQGLSIMQVFHEGKDIGNVYSWDFCWCYGQDNITFPNEMCAEDGVILQDPSPGPKMDYFIRLCVGPGSSGGPVVDLTGNVIAVNRSGGISPFSDGVGGLLDNSAPYGYRRHITGLLRKNRQILKTDVYSYAVCGNHAHDFVKMCLAKMIDNDGYPRAAPAAPPQPVIQALPSYSWAYRR